MPRLTADFWVSAYQRRRNGEGFFTAVERRGETSAGAIFVLIDRLDGTGDLYGPAPQSLIEDATADDHGGRLFERLLAKAEMAEITSRMERERRFDSDLWLIASEARDGSHGLGLV